MDRAEIDAHVAGCAAAHRRLLGHLDELVAAGGLDTDAPSQLPAWTVGHVLTHLARNADSHTRVIDGATRGEVLDQYEGGAPAREAAIEAGAHRPAGEQVADVRHSIDSLETAWAAAAARGWEGHWRGTIAGVLPLSELAFRRWREVEIHHADLGLAGFGVADWSPRYVAEELRRRTMEWTSRHPMGLTALPPAALALPPATRLAWLMGRATPDGLEPVRFA